MKIIFLDNDGVICLNNNWGSRTRKWNKWVKTLPESLLVKDAPVEYRFDDFDKKAVAVLNEIILKTGAEYVVSSDWKKFATLEELGEYYKTQGIIKEPIAMTKSFIGSEKPDGFEWVYKLRHEQERSLEINQFVKDNPEITHWVAVDDLTLGWTGKWGVKNFVHTPKMSEGIKQSGIKEKIIKFLTDKDEN
tara:strand:+ start:782 stop:1354 length:573 start_codon:yes stop_codon:yes gene_type:complete